MLFSTLKALYIWKRGISSVTTSAESTWIMWHQPYCAWTPTTHQLIGAEETAMKPTIDYYRQIIDLFAFVYQHFLLFTYLKIYILTNWAVLIIYLLIFKCEQQQSGVNCLHVASIW